jgi:hypothetical protein
MGKRKGGTLPCQKINKIDAYRKGEDPIKNTHGNQATRYN